MKDREETFDMICGISIIITWLIILVFGIGAVVIMLTSCSSHYGTLPDPDDTWPLPEVCLAFPLDIEDGDTTIKLPLGWINFADVDGDGWNDLIYSHWHDMSDVPGYQKCIAVWKNEGVGQQPSLLWYEIFDDPQPYLSYPDCEWEQGPLVAGNFIGGDNGQCEIAFRYWNGESQSFELKMVNGQTGKNIQTKSLDFQAQWAFGPMDLLAGNASRPRGNILSDLCVVYRHYGKTARRIECYRTRDLKLNWTYNIGDGNYKEHYGCHRPETLLYSNGRTVLWFGNGILDWNGKGIFDFTGIQPYPAELHGVGGAEPITNEQDDHHWDSICWWEGERGPSFIATTCSKRCWYFPGPEKRCYDGRCYVEWEATRFAGGEDEWGFNTTHIHRLRALSDNRFLCTDLPFDHHGTGGYRALICDKNFRILHELKTVQEAERIEFDGLRDSYEILTDYGIFDINGIKLAEHRGPRPNKIENNFICDLFGTGHEQYAFARNNQGTWEIVFISNPKAFRSTAIPPRINADFY